MSNTSPTIRLKEAMTAVFSRLKSTARRLIRPSTLTRQFRIMCSQMARRRTVSNAALRSRWMPLRTCSSTQNCRRVLPIPTPVGHYSPDWAIVFHEGAVRHIYFIAETKGTMDSLNLRPIEKAKIDCAKKLFTTLSNGMVTYDHVDDFQQLLNKVMA